MLSYLRDQVSSVFAESFRNLSLRKILKKNLENVKKSEKRKMIKKTSTCKNRNSCAILGSPSVVSTPMSTTKDSKKLQVFCPWPQIVRNGSGYQCQVMEEDCKPDTVYTMLEPGFLALFHSFKEDPEAQKKIKSFISSMQEKCEVDIGAFENDIDVINTDGVLEFSVPKRGKSPTKLFRDKTPAGNDRDKTSACKQSAPSKDDRDDTPPAPPAAKKRRQTEPDSASDEENAD